jgi:hypothetical protein
MTFTIEMTPRGVLLAGGFRTEAELNRTSTDDKRNTMIVELAKHTNQPGGYFQGLSDDDLVGALAISVFLLKAEVRDLDALQKLSVDDQRNILIIVNNGYTDKPIGELQGKTNKELVQLGLGWFSKTTTVAAILDFIWNIDKAKVASMKPDVLQTQTYNNLKSASPLHDKFVVSKEIRNTSTFSHDHSLDVTIGVATQFKAGIPFLAENKTTVSLEASTSNTWSFGEENTTTQSYHHESPVVVPPHGQMQLTSSVTRGTLDVPYSAKIRTADGTVRWIEGTWTGASTVNLIVEQVDLVNAKDGVTV